MENKGNVQVGAVKLHTSHLLFCFKGLYFCARCGYHASAKAQKLVNECTIRGPEANNRVRRLREGKLPSGMARWPNEAHVAAGIIELTDDQYATT